MAKPRGNKIRSQPAARVPFAKVKWSPKEILGAVAMVFVALGVFGASLRGDWLFDWDDHYMVLDNQNLRSLAGLWAIWTSPGADYWPITSTFLWLEWHLWGNQPLGYHLCCLGLHLLSGFLIWRVMAKLGLRWAWLAGLLFIIHPLAVSSVVWVSETKNTLSLPFFLLSFNAYLDFDRDYKKSDYLQSLGFYLVALLAKSSVVMLPVVLLLYCWWKRDRMTLKDILRSLPYFLIALLLGSITLYLQGHQLASDVLKPRPPLSVFLCAGYAIFFYLGKFIFPLGLCLIYPRWTFDSPTLLQCLTWPLLVALLSLLWWQRKTWGRHILFGLGFYLVMIFPVLGFVTMTYMKISWVADHFVYVPMIGLIALAVLGLERLVASFPLTMRPYGLGFIVLVLGWFALESFNYANTFTNEETLWTATMLRNPGALAAYTNLGLIMVKKGKPDQALPLLEQALRIDPNDSEAYSNMGAALLSLNREAEAIAAYEQALRIKPDYPVTHYNLGTLLLKEGQLPGAIEQLEEAVRLNPGYFNAQNNLAYALQQPGYVNEAIRHYQQCLQVNPNDAGAHYYLGAAYLSLNRFAEAADQFQIVLQLNPGMGPARDLLQKAQSLQGQALIGK